MLSVVILTLNSERSLVPTLAVLVQGAMSGLVREAIVSDGGSTDATSEVADYAGCVVLVSAAPLGARLAAAAAAARSPWLMFLRAGAVLDAAWLDETANHIERARSSANAEANSAAGPGSAAVFRKTAGGGAASSLRGAISLLGFGSWGRAHPDQGLLIPTQLYREIGGHRAASADPEADLLARLGRRRIVMLRSGVRTLHPGG
jgi:glycosyltransferase involved in cell wall biosynthesis